MTVDLDVVIFGGGCAGLWTLDEMRRRGLRALLVEPVALGSGQTVASQGIIHGGLKYSLRGAVSASAQGVAEMPERWRRHQAGEQEPDLSAMPLRAAWCCLWRTGSLRSRAGMLGARAGLRVQPRPLEPADRPRVLSGGSGTVYRLDEPVIDPAAFLEVMRQRNAGCLLRVDGAEGMELERADGGGVAAVRLRHPGGGGELILRPSRVVLTAGAGNAELRRRVGLDEQTMQRRPLHMVMVRGEPLESLFGHCVDGGATRVTITSARTSGGGLVWQVGGQVAERGVEMDRPTLLRHAREELRAAVPGFAEVEAGGELAWSAYRVDRAEERRADGARPEGVSLREEHNVLTAWPTKLALAPELAERVVERVMAETGKGGAGSPGGNESGAGADWPPGALRELGWPAPEVALPPWEQEQSWTVDP